MKRVIIGSSPLFMTEFGYENEDGPLESLDDWQSSITGIPFSCKIVLQWRELSYKPGTSQLDWSFVDGFSELNNEVLEESLKNFVSVCVEQDVAYDGEVASEFTAIKTYPELGNGFYDDEPVQDAVESYMKTSEAITKMNEYSDKISERDDLVVELKGKLGFSLYADKLNVNDSQSLFADVTLEYKNLTAKVSEISWVDVPDTDEAYEYV